MRGHEHTGRPLGSGSFVENLENTLGRVLKPKKAGRRPKKSAEIGMVSPDFQGFPCFCYWIKCH